MPVTRLATRRIEKVWGRHALGLGFADAPASGEPVGEIWFEAAGEPELLVKYLFTSEKLSVQVHPDDDQARGAGHRQGKEEAWLILAAEAGAVIGLGLRESIGEAELRAAAQDGSIGALLDWKPVAPGDFFYLPAGTIHAIGAGVALIEVQQNADLTYRLYDYGRPRDLHLDAAVAVARREAWRAPNAPRAIGEGRTVLAEGRKFVLERWTGERKGRLCPAASRPVWIAPLDGEGLVGDDTLAAGGVWMAEGDTPLGFDGNMLVAYPGGEFEPGLFYNS